MKSYFVYYYSVVLGQWIERHTPICPLCIRQTTYGQSDVVLLRLHALRDSYGNSSYSSVKLTSHHIFTKSTPYIHSPFLIDRPTSLILKLESTSQEPGRRRRRGFQVPCKQTAATPKATSGTGSYRYLSWELELNLSPPEEQKQEHWNRKRVSRVSKPMKPTNPLILTVLLVLLVIQYSSDSCVRRAFYLTI